MVDRSARVLMVGVAVEDTQRRSSLPLHRGQLIRVTSLVLSDPRSCDTADASSPGRTPQAAEHYRPCRVRAANTTFPTRSSGINRLYGLSDHQDLLARIGDAPLTRHYAVSCNVWDRGRGDTNGN